LCWQQQLDKQAIREDFALLAIQKQNKKEKKKPQTVLVVELMFSRQVYTYTHVMLCGIYKRVAVGDIESWDG
jgi:tryptophanase